jgi:hypothetical protein
MSEVEMGAINLGLVETDPIPAADDEKEERAKDNADDHALLEPPWALPTHVFGVERVFSL